MTKSVEDDVRCPRPEDLVALRPLTDRGLAVTPMFGTARAHDALVHGSLDAVVLLDVKLRQCVVIEDRSFADIT